MAEAAQQGEPLGPNQRGRGVQGQYVYWICMAHPMPETVEKLGLKVPSDFDRHSFSQLVVKAHGECDIEIIETACFLEPHASGLMHHNCLVRATKKFRWARPAERLRREYKVCVSYGENVKTWAQGVIYGRVGSEHKGPEMLDQAAIQWAKHGDPAKFEEFIPKQWQKSGFQRKTKMSNLAFLDICKEHQVQTEAAAWALAEDLEGKGDRALMAYLWENDASSALAKVQLAVGAKEAARRGKLGRMEILRETAEFGRCTCDTPGLCYGEMKQTLAANHLEGAFQREVVATLIAGRKRMRNLCLVGGPGTGKSHVFKPLALIFKTYSRPDGGSYQLEDLLGKELVFLNDFEYDEDAKKWCPWGYFKRFLEGEKLDVARPKNRGGNQPFNSDAPVFFTAPQTISLYRGKKRDDYETSQMDERVKYAYFNATIPREQRHETNPCAHCGARLYLEGDPEQVVPAPQAALDVQSQSSGSGSRRGHEEVAGLGEHESRAVRCKTGLEMLEALKEVQALKHSGIIDTPEAKSLKDNIFSDCA